MLNLIYSTNQNKYRLLNLFSYKTHSQFHYKGVDNDDVAVFTGVFQRTDDTWKLVHGQRSTGQKPETA